MGGYEVTNACRGCLTHGEKNRAGVEQYSREAGEKTMTQAVDQLK